MDLQTISTITGSHSDTWVPGGRDPITDRRLRDFFASTALANGIPIHEVSRRLGHRSIKVTADIYGHLVRAWSRCREILQSAMRPVPQDLSAQGHVACVFAAHAGPGWWYGRPKMFLLGWRKNRRQRGGTRSMCDRPASMSLGGSSARSCFLEPLERRPIGTNGYVSTWGAIMSVCPPMDR
ncbi:hypothetical protein AB0903_12300 [Streptomyces sp. NPDC048389]|uniref:hypothetical protein n=1 Tax=Streptomyces sp. NPDC048389 TaxID=3154622 RepID=UPI0034554658